MSGSGLTSARIKTIIERIEVQTKEAIIRETRRRTDENQAAIRAAFGNTAPITRFVDGVEGKALEDVKPNGVTLTEFDLFSHVITETWNALVLASPYGPDEGGHYRDDHWLFVNGTRRDAATEGGKIEIKAGDDIVFVNARPYARKIEGGAVSRFRKRLTDRRPGLSVQAPDGVYEITAAALNRRLGNLASFRFAYRGIVGGVPLLASGPRRKGVKKRAQNNASDRYPAIEIMVR